MAEMSDRRVEESRRLLRSLLSRRDFVAAAGVGALTLTGCGGGSSPTGTTPPPPPGGGRIPTGFQSMTGTVSLPSGSRLDPATLSVDVLTQKVAVSASGGFTVGISPDGPALALLLDANGDGVLMAMFDAGLTNRTVSAHTTAVAMLHFAMGAYALSPAAMSQILPLLDGDPAVAALASTVGVAVAADPHALANNASSLAPAVRQALATILGTTLPNARAATSTGNLANSDVPTLMLLTPTAAQNGVQVSQDATTTSLLISNTKRRGCKVYVYEVTTLTGSVTTDVIPAVLASGPFALDSVENLSLFTSLKDFTTFFHGTSPWSPVNLPAIPLTLAPSTADRTTYQVIVLASSPKWVSQDTFEPPFFRDQHFANEVAKWRADTQALFAATLLGDIILPILCFFGGFGAIVQSHVLVAGLMADSATLGSQTYKWIIDNLEFGSLGKLEAGLAKVVQDAVYSTNSTQFWKPKVRAVISNARQLALDIESVPTFATRLGAGAKMFQSVFEPVFAAGLILDGIDFGYVISEWFNSDLGASWTALLMRQKLNLKPASPRVAAGERVSFNVSLPANTPGGNFQYDWTQSSPFATLSAVGEANVGSQITTSQLNVDLLTKGSDVNPINVLVVGYDTSSGQRVEIGRAGTVVSFLRPCQILPSSPPLLTNGDQRLYSVVVGGDPLPNGVKYRWTLTGTSGTIGASNIVLTDLPQVNYIANAPGTDLLHVDVLDGAGTLLARAEVNVTIAAAASIKFDVAGAWNLNPYNIIQEPPNGHYAYTSFGSARFLNAGSGAGFDVVLMGYDLTSNGQQGVTLSLLVAAGRAITAGQTFATTLLGQVATIGQFRLVLDPDQVNPTNTIYGQDATYGTLRIDTLGQLTDGTFVANYSFNVGNNGGGTIIGSGTARWKDDGTGLTS